MKPGWHKQSEATIETAESVVRCADGRVNDEAEAENRDGGEQGRSDHPAVTENQPVQIDPSVELSEQLVRIHPAAAEFGKRLKKSVAPRMEPSKE